MYEISYREIAADEYIEAINWYEAQSTLAASGFIKAVNDKLDIIGSDPRRYKNLFRHYYEVSTNRYPYTIVHFIEEQVRKVIIIAIYHHKRSPRKKYRR